MPASPAPSFESYFRALSAPARESFAADSGTSVEYIRDHLLAGRRMPRPSLVDGMVAALAKRRAGIGRDALVVFFHRRRGRAAA